MKRAYAFLSLLIITSAARPLIIAQQPNPHPPIITRQSFLAEALRRRLSLPAPEAPVEQTEEPILRIETVALRLPDPNAGLGPPKPLLRDLSSVYETALFQRQRYRETGQPIEFERGRIYFRQDRMVATRGLILYRLWENRIDFGLYRRSFNGEASPVRAQMLWFGMADSSGRRYEFNSGRQIFFGVRFNLDKRHKR